jgi:hypothetical protein
MNTEPNARTVECAESLGEIYHAGSKTQTIVAFMILAGCFILADWMETPWLGVVSLLIVGSKLVIPRVIKIHRHLCALPCPHCGLPVGGYKSRMNRLYVHCKHCGKTSPTDCTFSFAGGPPTKI